MQTMTHTQGTDMAQRLACCAVGLAEAVEGCRGMSTDEISYGIVAANVPPISSCTSIEGGKRTDDMIACDIATWRGDILRYKSLMVRLAERGGEVERVMGASPLLGAVRDGYREAVRACECMRREAEALIAEDEAELSRRAVERAEEEARSGEAREATERASRTASELSSAKRELERTRAELEALRAAMA